MHSQIPLTRDLVLLGGGHTHALVLRKWGMRPLAGARLTVVNPGPMATYTGMLPGHVAGHYPREALDIDIVRLARFANARWIDAKAEGLDLDNRTITVAGRPSLHYDVLSIDIGVSSAMPGLPGFSENAHPVKPLGPFATRWEGFVQDVSEGRAQPHAAVIGAGVAGTELSLAMLHRLRQISGAAARISLVEAQAAFKGVPEKTARRLRSILQEAGVILLEDATITRVDPGALVLAGGKTIDFAFCAGAAGAKPQDWLRDTGLPLHEGYLTVDRHLRVAGPVFAAGDCVHMTETPRPKAGVYAVRQAPILFDNLRAELSGGTHRAFKPQTDYLKLISLGEKSALADKYGVVLAGAPMWRLKDRIDRAFMQKLDDLPDMPQEKLPAELASGVRETLGDRAPLCGGCGSKVGLAGLQSGLRSVPMPHRDDVLSQPGDDAAILQIENTRQVITSDHLRAVTDDPFLMARIAAIHALGDIWAMGAAPQAALSTLILPRMSPDLQAATLAEITAGAASVLTAEGADLVGGHTTQGPELTIGFTITGIAEAAPITVAGAQPGNALLLTRPIGSGTLLAAEMRRKARGDWVVSLFEQLVQPQGALAQILRQHATAMTDVTGFGLAGHLLLMAEASDVSIDIDLDAIRFFDGAIALAETGVRSTIFAENSAFARPRMAGFPDGPRTDLLLDPQTCGGLLVAVPSDHAEELLLALSDAGCAAMRIGTAQAGPAMLTCV